MVRVGAIEFKFSFKGDTIRQTALQTLFDRVAGRVNIVIDEFQNEIVSGIGNGEILREHLVEAFVFTILGRGV